MISKATARWNSPAHSKSHAAGARADLLFVLAESQPAGGFRAALSSIDQLKAADLPSPEALEGAGPGGFLSEILIDHLDLDGDGTGELFTYGQSFEGAQYTVYKKTRGRWLKLQEFYVYRAVLRGEMGRG